MHGGGGTSSAADAATDATVSSTFESVEPNVYVAKVKNLLLSLPPNDDEIASITADPTQLKALITSWQQLPQYSQKMRRFFELAFQQTQVSVADFADQSYPQPLVFNTTTTPLLVQNAEQSFARTMLGLVAQGQPWTQSMTTPSLMLTTALKEFYAFLDVWEVDDNGKVTDGFKQANPSLTLYVGASSGPIALTDSLDPSSANYMRFYDADVTSAQSLRATRCSQQPGFRSFAITVIRLLVPKMTRNS